MGYDQISFPGKRLLKLLLIDPVTRVSPVIAESYLYSGFGKQSPLYSVLEKWNSDCICCSGIILATIFIYVPFVSEIIPVLESIGSDEGKGSSSDGSKGAGRFLQK